MLSVKFIIYLSKRHFGEVRSNSTSAVLTRSAACAIPGRTDHLHGEGTSGMGALCAVGSETSHQGARSGV